jgi:hypothetical protein
VLLAAGLLAANALTAHADTAGSCTANTAIAPDCNIAVYVPDPQTIDLQVTATAAGTSVNVDWTANCGYYDAAYGGASGVSTPADESVTLHKNVEASDCILAAAVWLASGSADTSITLTVNYTPHDPGTAKVTPVKIPFGGDSNLNIASCEQSVSIADSCTMSAVITSPVSIGGGMSVSPSGAEGAVKLSWTSDCGGVDESGSTTGAATGPGGGGLATNLTLGATNPGSCTVRFTAQVLNGPITGFTASLQFLPQTPPAPAATPTPTASAPPVHLVRGFDGMCVRDMGDSAAPRTKIVAWACDPTAQGQSWTYAGDELKIHGNMCMNAKGKGASGAKVLLWPCTGAPNEIWVHGSGGEYALKASRYKTCLTDPGYSTSNGTQLSVTACAQATDQKWSLP